LLIGHLKKAQTGQKNKKEQGKIKIKIKMEKKMENLGDLRREGTEGGELFTNEIAGGDVRDTKEVREARGVGAFSDAGAVKENPLDKLVVMAEREGLSV
jgi:hypothetical protein